MIEKKGYDTLILLYQKTIMGRQLTKTKGKKSKRKSVILWILFVVALCGLLFSGYKIYTILHGYGEAKDVYRTMEEEMAAEKGADQNEFRPDFQKLKKENPDCVAWIRCDGVFSYPVVKGKDNVYYLTHLFDGTENSCGTIFMDTANRDADDQNCILYGHNMQDESMFGTLYKYGEESYYKEHPVMDLYTETDHYRYEVLSAYRTPVTGPVYQIGFSSEEAFLNMKKDVASCCPYETACEIKGNSAPLLTLSTCTYDSSETDRYVVVLQRMDEEKEKD